MPLDSEKTKIVPKWWNVVPMASGIVGPAVVIIDGEVLFLSAAKTRVQMAVKPRTNCRARFEYFKQRDVG